MRKVTGLLKPNPRLAQMKPNKPKVEPKMLRSFGGFGNQTTFGGLGGILAKRKASSKFNQSNMSVFANRRRGRAGAAVTNVSKLGNMTGAGGLKRNALYDFFRKK